MVSGALGSIGQNRPKSLIHSNLSMRGWKISGNGLSLSNSGMVGYRKQAIRLPQAHGELKSPAHAPARRIGRDEKCSTARSRRLA